MFKKIQIPAIFKNHQFLRLWGNQILLQVSFNMCNYTALLILADRTHSPFVQAQLYAAITIPAFVFGIIAGPVVDMVERKMLMLVTDLMLAVLFLSYAFAGANVAIIMTIAFLTSSVARFFIPAEAATIPLVVSEETLEHANTFFLFTLLGSVLLGYAIAGPVIQLFGGLRTTGEVAPFILSSILLVVGFVLRLSLKKFVHIRPEVPKGTIFKQTMHLFWQTVEAVRNNSSISLPIMFLVFVEFIIGILSVLLLEYVRRYLNLPLSSISYVLMGPLILGLIAGVALLPKLAKKGEQYESILFASVSVGIAFLLLGFAPFITGVFVVRLATVVLAFFMGIAVAVIAIQARTILQINSKKEMHGRVFSFLDIMIAFITPVPVLVLGFLAEKISILYMLLAIGIIIVSIMLMLGNIFKNRLLVRDNSN